MRRKINDLPALKEALRAHVDIVEYIGRHVELHPQGRNWFGRCPFHDDSTPSFNVSPDKAPGLWSCLGCREAGDLFRFVERFFQLSFIEAVEVCAEQTGFELAPYLRPLTADEELDRQLFGATDRLADLLCDQLLQRPELVDFFYERGITPQSIERFKCGFCPSVDFIDSVVDREVLEMIEPSKQRREALFSGHILYPQFTASGDVWGWFARVGGTPKYWGPSSESKLFQGGGRLYGLHLARKMKDMREAGAILVEGFNDAIAAQQYGFPAIAVCGTQLSADQVEALHLYAVRRATVVFDGDDGGRDGMMKLALRSNQIKDLTLKFATVAGDPDETLAQGGRQAFTQVLEQAVYGIEYILRADEDGDLTTVTDQLDFLHRVRPVVLTYPRHSIERAVAANLIAGRLGVDRLAVEDFIEEGLPDDPMVSMLGERVLLAELIYGDDGFIRFPELVEQDFDFSRHRRLFSLLRTMYHDGLLIEPDVVYTEARNANLGASVMELIQQIGTISRSNVDYLYKDVREKSLRRQALTFTAKAGLAIHDLALPAEKALADLTESITSLVVRPSRNVLVGSPEVADTAVARMLERQRSDNAIVGLDLGPDWHYLMASISGFCPQAVHLVCAVSGVGKSIVAVANWVHKLSITEDGPRAAGVVFGMEMTSVQNVNRIAAIDSRVPQICIRDGRFASQEQVQLVIDSMRRIKQSNVTWVERTLGMREIAFQSRLLKARGKLDYIVIDYLQLLDLSDYNDRWSKTEKFGAASADLHDLAGDLDVPIIAVAQLNRKAYENEIHTGEDIGECYKFYQDAHVCYVLTSHGDEKLLGYLDKTRDGPSKKAVDLAFSNKMPYATLRVNEIAVREMP